MPDDVGVAVGVAVACDGVVAIGVAVGLVVVVVLGVFAIKATHPNVSSKTTTMRPTTIIFLLKPNMVRGLGGGLYGGCCLNGVGAADGAVRGGDAAANAAPQFAQYTAFGRVGSPQFRQYFCSSICVSPLTEKK